MYIKTPVKINGVVYEEWEIRSVCWELDKSVLTFNLHYYDKDGAGEVLHRQLEYSVGKDVDINELTDKIKAEHKGNIHI
jgi:hypothetical protein